MAIEIEDIPIKNGDFPVRYVSLPGNILGVEFPLPAYAIRALLLHGIGD
jgi:hypothetical protein